jgi:hypothetical protein
VCANDTGSAAYCECFYGLAVPIGADPNSVTKCSGEHMKLVHVTHAHTSPYAGGDNCGTASAVLNMHGTKRDEHRTLCVWRMGDLVVHRHNHRVLSVRVSMLQARTHTRTGYSVMNGTRVIHMMEEVTLIITTVLLMVPFETMIATNLVWIVCQCVCEFCVRADTMQAGVVLRSVLLPSDHGILLPRIITSVQVRING